MMMVKAEAFVLDYALDGLPPSGLSQKKIHFFLPLNKNVGLDFGVLRVGEEAKR